MVCRICAAGEAGQRTEIRIAVRRTHLDGLEADTRRDCAACPRNPWPAPRAPAMSGSRSACPAGRPAKPALRRRAPPDRLRVIVCCVSSYRVGTPALAILARKIFVGFRDVGDLVVRRIVIQTAPRAQRHGVQIHCLRNSAGMQETSRRLRAALAGRRPLAQARRQLSRLASARRRRRARDRPSGDPESGADFPPGSRIGSCPCRRRTSSPPRGTPCDLPRVPAAWAAASRLRTRSGPPRPAGRAPDTGSARCWQRGRRNRSSRPTRCRRSTPDRG